MLMTEMKKVLAKTVAVQQGDRCKYLYFVNFGQFTILRQLSFIEKVTVPLAQQYKHVEGTDREAELIKLESNLPYLDPTDYACISSVKQLQIAHLAKGKMFGDHNLENDFKIERKAGDNAECQEFEPYSIYTQNPAELFFIERLIFAQCIEPSDIHEYTKLKPELPGDQELRKKFI